MEWRLNSMLILIINVIFIMEKTNMTMTTIMTYLKLY